MKNTNMKNITRFALAAILLSTAPAMAAPAASGAQIELAAPHKNKNFILGGAVWTCEGTTCSTTRAPDLPVIVACKRVVAITGEARAFTLRGKAFSEAQLAQCNAAVKS